MKNTQTLFLFCYHGQKTRSVPNVSNLDPYKKNIHFLWKQILDVIFILAQAVKEFTQQWSKVTGVRTVITYPLTPKSLTTLAFTVNEKTAVIFKRPGLQYVLKNTYCRGPLLRQCSFDKLQYVVHWILKFKHKINQIL